MIKLLSQIEYLKDSPVKNIVECRMRDFEQAGKGADAELFKELCFCILTANFDAEKSVKIQHKIDNGFLTMSEEALASKLKELGHRFPNARAHYIVEARKYKNMLRPTISSLNGEELRKWLAKNIRGIGYKETSHFLRNIGFKDYAIVDFHILDILADHKIIEKPHTLTRKAYLDIENRLKKLARQSELNLAELDLYLWFLETSKICK